MEVRLLEILPKTGLGPLRFGMSEADVEAAWGPAEEVADFDPDRHLYYPSRGVFLFFPADEDGLSGIEVSSACGCSLAGQEVFPRDRKRTAALLDSLVPGGSSSGSSAVVHVESDRGTRISSQELGIDFYFSADGRLESVQLGAP